MIYASALRESTDLLAALAVIAGTLSVGLTVRLWLRERTEKALAEYLVSRSETRVHENVHGVPAERARDALAYLAYAPLHAFVDNDPLTTRTMSVLSNEIVQQILRVEDRRDYADNLAAALSHDKVRNEVAEWRTEHSRWRRLARTRLLRWLIRPLAGIGRTVARLWAAKSPPPDPTATASSTG